jgi:hypothetical protein
VNLAHCACHAVKSATVAISQELQGIAAMSVRT